MSLDPRNHGWDRQLEDALPDCRVKAIDRDKVTHRLGRLQLDVVFCANCGEPKGAVTPNVPHVFFVCDQCVGVMGPPPGAVEVIG